MKRAILICTLLSACFFQPAACLSQPPAHALAVALATEARPMTLVLDAREAPRGMMESHMTIPVTSGVFTLVYPKWIPGEHGPTGPLNDLSQLRITADGRALEWRRDTVDMYAFHVEVPPGVSTIHVDTTVLLNAPGDMMATRNVAIVNWNRDLVYQNDVSSHEYYVKPSIILPPGWSFGTALPDPRRSGDRVDFDTVPLNTLIDSPLDLGRYSKHILLWQSGNMQQWLDAFADKPQDLDFPQQEVDAYKRMAPQAFALYGSRHWNEYHALLTLSDQIGFQGIEHHQSSDNRAPDDFMINPKEQLSGGDLITHEFSHSWNGKYRRPDDLTTVNFQIPQQTDLLWVYEGMNQYLGDVLKYRTNIGDRKTYPEYVASVYAALDNEPGRMSTPIIDTTTGAPYFYEARGQYSSMRRAAGDFYAEGHLIWLAADITIRSQTGGKKSLDDFEHLFTGPGVTGPITKTYTRDDVENLLNQVAPYDWHAFFQRYVYDVAPHPPYNDLERAGWRLSSTDKPNEYIEASDELDHSIDCWYSIGLRLSGDGTVRDVREGSPAWNSGIAAGAKVVAVDDQQFASDALEYAIKHSKDNAKPITLLTSLDGWYTTHLVNYHGGLRYPHLVRIAGRPDMLSRIVAPR